MTRTISKAKTTPRYSDAPDSESLFYMLQTMRPAGSKTEEDFIRQWIQPLGTETDGYGNEYIRIGDSPVMFSSHTDTVHRTEGYQKIKHKAGWISLASDEKDASCLGADCTAGVWLMREMILAGKAGLYVFHREEECGGHGSAWLAKNHGGLLDGIQACIALDRKGTDSIITEQWGGRCASEAFAASMGKQFKGYKADPTGSFTDSANYTAIIPECTNLSVGYEAQHTKEERQAYFHLLELRDMLLRFDIRKVAIQRTPVSSETYSKGYTASAWGAWEDETWEDDSAYWTKGTGKGGTWAKAKASPSNRAARNVYEFCRLYPDEVADLLCQYGITLAEMYEATPYVD